MNDEKGLTLIEVLASIVISTIILGIIFSVLINSANNYQDIKKRIDLQQQATIIVETLRNYHRRYDEYKLISINQEAYVEINGVKQRLGQDGIKVQLKAGSDRPNNFSNETFKTLEPLYLSLKLVYEDQKFELESMINRY